MLILVEITSFAVDPSRNAPLLLLKECGGERTLPVPLGPVEASAIAIKSLNVKTDKPLTIDLVRAAVESLGAYLDRVVIYDYGNDTYSTRLHIVNNRNVSIIDCSASDGISLAMRCNAPVFVEEQVFGKKNGGDGLSDAEILRKNIRDTDTVNFGTYYLE